MAYQDGSGQWYNDQGEAIRPPGGTESGTSDVTPGQPGRAEVLSENQRLQKAIAEATDPEERARLVAQLQHNLDRAARARGVVGRVAGGLLGGAAGFLAGGPAGVAIGAGLGSSLGGAVPRPVGGSAEQEVAQYIQQHPETVQGGLASPANTPAGPGSAAPMEPPTIPEFVMPAMPAGSAPPQWYDTPQYRALAGANPMNDPLARQGSALQQYASGLEGRALDPGFTTGSIQQAQAGAAQGIATLRNNMPDVAGQRVRNAAEHQQVLSMIDEIEVDPGRFFDQGMGMLTGLASGAAGGAAAQRGALFGAMQRAPEVARAAQMAVMEAQTRKAQLAQQEMAAYRENDTQLERLQSEAVQALAGLETTTALRIGELTAQERALVGNMAIAARNSGVQLTSLGVNQFLDRLKLEASRSQSINEQTQANWRTGAEIDAANWRAEAGVASDNWRAVVGLYGNLYSTDVDSATRLAVADKIYDAEIRRIKQSAPPGFWERIGGRLADSAITTVGNALTTAALKAASS